MWFQESGILDMWFQESGIPGVNYVIYGVTPSLGVRVRFRFKVRVRVRVMVRVMVRVSQVCHLQSHDLGPSILERNVYFAGLSNHTSCYIAPLFTHTACLSIRQP